MKAVFCCSVVLVGILSLAPGHRTQVGPPAGSAAQFEITPKRPLVDDKVSVRLLHLKPGQRVTVRARMVEGPDDVRLAQEEFVADAQGRVDLGTVPIDSQEKQVAPLRILWSMKKDQQAKEVAKTKKGALDPFVVSFTAETDGKEIAKGTLELLMVSQDVVRTPVRDKGLVGTLFRPAGKGRWPGIMVLAGSQGGLPEPPAALLASHGYAVLALAYFRYENLPKNLVKIPLEYFATALHWMKTQDCIDGGHLAVMGTSRGGELALLLGATFPEIKTVVAIVPSHIAWGAYSADARDDDSPAWTYKGKAVPFMSTPPDPDLMRLVLIADPAVYTPGFALSLANTDDVRRAAIAVEKIQGPVLLLSGKDDKLWPSAYMADRAMKRLAEHKHPFPDEHLSYRDCGHAIGLPNLPVRPSRIVHAVTKEAMELGGTLEGSAFAAWDSRPRLHKFLEKNLKKPG